MYVYIYIYIHIIYIYMAYDVNSPDLVMSLRFYVIK